MSKLSFNFMCKNTANVANSNNLATTTIGSSLVLSTPVKTNLGKLWKSSLLLLSFVFCMMAFGSNNLEAQAPDPFCLLDPYTGTMPPSITYKFCVGLSPTGEIYIYIWDITFLGPSHDYFIESNYKFWWDSCFADVIQDALDGTSEYAPLNGYFSNINMGQCNEDTSMYTVIKLGIPNCITIYNKLTCYPTPPDIPKPFDPTWPPPADTDSLRGGGNQTRALGNGNCHSSYHLEHCQDINDIDWCMTTKKYCWYYEINGEDTLRKIQEISSTDSDNVSADFCKGTTKRVCTQSDTRPGGRTIWTNVDCLWQCWDERE